MSRACVNMGVMVGSRKVMVTAFKGTLREVSARGGRERKLERENDFMASSDHWKEENMRSVSPLFNNTEKLTYSFRDRTSTPGYEKLIRKNRSFKNYISINFTLISSLLDLGWWVGELGSWVG